MLFLCLTIWTIYGEFLLFILLVKTWTKINVQYNQMCRHFNRYCIYLCEGHIEHFLVCSTTISSSWFHWKKNGRTTKIKETHCTWKRLKNKTLNRKYYWAEYCYGILHTIDWKRVGLYFRFCFFFEASKTSSQMIRCSNEW